MEQQNAAEILEDLTFEKTMSEAVEILSRKTLMSAVTMLELEEFYQKNLAGKTSCANEAEVFLCRVAGAAKAWLMDI